MDLEDNNDHNFFETIFIKYLFQMQVFY